MVVPARRPLAVAAGPGNHAFAGEDLSGGTLAFEIFTPDGARRTTVTLPDGVRLLDVGPEYVVVRRTDELGVEFIQVLQLDRGI